MSINTQYLVLQSYIDCFIKPGIYSFIVSYYLLNLFVIDTQLKFVLSLFICFSSSYILTLELNSVPNPVHVLEGRTVHGKFMIKKRNFEFRKKLCFVYFDQQVDDLKSRS